MRISSISYYSVVGEGGTLANFATKNSAMALAGRGPKRIVEKVKIYDSLAEYEESKVDALVDSAVAKLTQAEYEALETHFRRVEC